MTITSADDAAVDAGSHAAREHETIALGDARINRTGAEQRQEVNGGPVWLRSRARGWHAAAVQ